MREETREVVIRIRPQPASTQKRMRETTEHMLTTALQRMRIEGFEVDLYLRGTWCRSNSTAPRVFPETRWDGWRLMGDALKGTDEVFPPGDWMPMPSRNPPPELVLRGARRVR